MVTISEIQFEHFRAGNVLGIGASKPRISWKAIDTPNDYIQKSYEIQLLKPDGSVIESVTKESEQSVLVEWPFAPLASKQRAYIRAKLSDSDFSEPSFVETGILTRQEWKGCLIQSDYDEDVTEPKPETFFRRSFTVRDASAKGRIYVTAQGVFEVEVNGAVVSKDVLAPGWSSYTHRIREHVYDISEFLVKGENSVGIRVAEGWFSGRLGMRAGVRNMYGTRVGVLANIDIAYATEVDSIATDKSWIASYGPARLAEIYNGEKYDANFEIPLWSKATCDTSAWTGVVEKPIPEVEIFLPYAPTAAVIERVKPIEIIKSVSGKTILDFGQNLVGYIEFTAGPARKGHTVTFRHVEVLEHGEVCVRPLRNSAQTDTYTYSGTEKSVTWHPRFTFHGFRYAEVSNWPGELTLDSFEALVIHNDFKRTGWFETSSDMINRLYENVRWSMKGNFLELPTDCPQRNERLGWTGDIQIFAPTAMYLYDVSGMLESWLRDLYEEQCSYGGIPSVVVPDVMHLLPTHDSEPCAVWQDAAVIVPYALFRATGDLKILDTQYQSMVDWVAAIPRDESGLLWAKGFQYGDWLDPLAPPDKPALAMTDPKLVADAYILYVLNLMVEISALLGKEEDVKHYSKLALKVKTLFRHEYVTPAGRIACDTQTAYALCIIIGVLTPSEEKRAGARLGEMIVSNEFRIATGFAGTPIICPALTKVGRSDLAYKMLLCRENPSWLYPVTMGATTIWERWDSMLPDGRVNPGQMTSFNHYALGSVAQWMHETVAGFHIDVPGWKKVTIKPTPDGKDFEFVNAKFDSPYGVYKSEWSIKNGFELRVTVPANARATVVLPNGDKFEMGSGTKTFTC